MEQLFYIFRIETSMDMGIGNRSAEFMYIDMKEAHAGGTFLVFDKELTINTLDDDKMEFSFCGHTYVINRYWQVLGTPEFHIPNERIAENGRYVFLFSKDRSITCEWSDSHISELTDQIDKNSKEGNHWKNIPLVREFIHELKDVAPHRGNGINPAYKAHYIAELLLKRNCIDRAETPRLFHSLCELYRLYIDYKYMEDMDQFLKEHFDEYYFRNVDDWIYRFAWIVDNPTGNIGLESWDCICRSLKIDPVQATPEWEEVIYDVEKEIDEELKDEPRGMGFCFGYWSAKRAALARRGIEWNSPASMNPSVRFD